MREDKLRYQETKSNFINKAHEDLLAVLRKKNQIDREINEILKNRNCHCDPQF